MKLGSKSANREFKELREQWNGLVWKVFKLRMPSYHKAGLERDDLLQDLQVALWLGDKSYKEGYSKVTWLYTALIQHTSKQLKMAYRRQNRSLKAIEALKPTLTEWSHELEEDPLECLYPMVERLSQHSMGKGARKVVELGLTGKSFLEIAKILNIKPHAVYGRIRNLKEKLKKYGNTINY